MLEVYPGVLNGETLRIQGAGSAGLRGAPSGDLLVRVEVRPHKMFTRRDNDLLLRVPISFSQAVLGATIVLPFVDGSAYNVEIPTGIPKGFEVRLSQQGFGVHSGKRGDWVIQTFVVIPQEVSVELQKLLEELQQISEPQKEAHPLLQEFWRQRV
jgi:molecular chaperone DnaJ